MSRTATAEKPVAIPQVVVRPEEVVVSYPEGWDEQLAKFLGLLAQIGKNIRNEASYLVGCQAYYLISKLLKGMDAKREEVKGYYARMCSKIDAVFSAITKPLATQKEQLRAKLSAFATAQPGDSKNDWVKVADSYDYDVYAAGKIPDRFYKPREIDWKMVEAEVAAGKKVPDIKAIPVKLINSR